MEKTTMRHLAAALTLAALVAPAAHADEAALQAEIEALRAEVAALKDAVQQMRSERAPVAAAPAVSTGTATATPMPAAPGPTAVASAAQPAPVATTTAVARAGNDGATNLWGYGELNYNHPTANASDAQADLRRAVLGFSHAFDDTTRVYGEIEWEHAIASADDQGEVEVEQLYVEHALAPSYGVRAGLVLIPLGLLNEHHEPTNYYGVERNFVETAIIPSTWREGGF